MDVSCPRCKTDYEFDDARVPDAGVTVKCTSCSHVFRVRKKSMPPPQAAQTKPGDETVPALPRTAPAQREWKVRQPSGNVFSFKELTTLQKWIVERKVSRDDEISLTGESWKRLGNIAELASFFQVVDDAKKAQELEALQAAEKLKPPPPPPPSAPLREDAPRAASQSGSVPAPGERAGVQQIPAEATGFPGRGKALHEAPTLPPDEPVNSKRKLLTETLRDPAFTLPPPRVPDERPPPFRPPQPPAPPPRAREVPSELVEIQAREDVRQLKQGGGAGKWIGLLLVLLGVGGAAGYYFVVYAPEQQRLKELADIQARARTDEEARQREEETRRAAERAGAEQKKKDDEAALAAVAAAAVVDAGPAVVDAGVALAEKTEKPDKTEKKDDKKDEKKDEKKGCKTVDCWIAQGDRLRDRERAEAALEAYSKALDLKPDNVEALTNKGLCYLDMAKPVVAEPILEQALKLNPRYAPAIMGLAESYRFQGKKEAAIGMYQKYLDNFPSGPEASVARSNIERLR